MPLRGQTGDSPFVDSPNWNRTYEGSATGVQDSQVIEEIAQSIKVGEIEIYETAEAYYKAQKEELEETC